jgi:hypothetical protein
MQCPTCPDKTVAAFCRECGKPVCRECAVEIAGVPHCAECAAAHQAAVSAAAERPARETPALLAEPAPEWRPTAGPAPGYAGYEDPNAPHPILAGVFGFVPGLGAVYNGQYVKGLLHVILFGVLMTIATSTGGGGAALFVPLIALLYLYMPIEAVRTASALRRGERVEEMSGLVGALFADKARTPAAGVTLIALGVVALLFSLRIVRVSDLAPYWPALLIALGVYWLYTSVRGRRESESPAQPAADDFRA